MEHYYWNDWYAGWGWFLWFGMFILIFSSAGNWGYTYTAHRKYDDQSGKRALNILNERYAKGEIAREEYLRMKSEIKTEVKNEPKTWQGQKMPRSSSI